MEPVSVQDQQEAEGFGGNQDGADPPSLEERVKALEEQRLEMLTLLRQLLDNAVPKPKD